MADPIGGAAANQVVQKAVPVRGHRDEVDVFLRRDLDQLACRIAERETRARVNPR